MSSDEMNVARYIRERSEELQRLSADARLDLLTHVFGIAALEAAKHECDTPPLMKAALTELEHRALRRQKETRERQIALKQILEGLVGAAVNRTGGEARAAFYVTNELGTGLNRIAGMSEAYGAYTNGFKIGTQSIACGLAAATRRPVITDDVARDPAWTPWQWLADAFNYRGCWSFPIEGRGGKLFGTFSMYFDGPSQATDHDIQFASMMTDAAAEIIGRHGSI